MPNRALSDRTVIGEHPKYSQREHKEQRPIQEFLDVLDALFAFPEVEAIRWEQYTPYFNDGDVCIFGIGEASIKFSGDTGYCQDGFFDGYSYPPGYWDTHYESYLYGCSRRWNGRSYETVVKESPEGKIPSDYEDKGFYINGKRRDDIEKAFDAVNKEIYSEVHADDFLDVFGDPAQVTATRAGFSVEFYDHE